MYKETKIADLFSNIDQIETETPWKDERIVREKEINSVSQTLNHEPLDSRIAETETIHVKKIVWFYENNSFEEFYPRKT
jgi:hypothetical protein